MNTMKYKEYLASVEYSNKNDGFIGEVLGINDIIIFEGQTVSELKKAFRESVDDYIIACEKVGRNPEKTCKGQFSVRTTPEIHRELSTIADSQGITLNKLVNEVFAEYITDDK